LADHVLSSSVTRSSNDQAGLEFSGDLTVVAWKLGTPDSVVKLYWDCCWTVAIRQSKFDF